VRGIAGAAALALAVGGCGAEPWFLLPLVDASVTPVEDQAVGAEEASPEMSPQRFGCTTDPECIPLNRHCDTLNHVCVQCVQHSDCQQQTQLPWCSPQHQCVACLSAPTDTCGPEQACLGTRCFYLCPDGGNCPTFKPFCVTNQSRFVCAACRNRDDCSDAAVMGVCDFTLGVGECNPDQAINRQPGTDGGASLDSGDAATDVAIGDAADAGD
jgi:hypothetical protein